MAAFDIGSAAIDRTVTQGTSTYIDTNNPADNNGWITSIEIWADSELSNVEVATFTEGAANVFTTRDTHSIGTIAAGSKQTFSGLSIVVATGDYIGIYFSGGLLERTSAGDGMWYLSGDYIPTTTTEFNFNADRTLSIYGVCTTEEPPKPSNAISLGANF